MTMLPEMYLSTRKKTKKLVKFWKSSASGCGSKNFLKDYSTLRDWVFFHNLAYISGETKIFVKISLQMYPRTGKCSLNFGGDQEQELGIVLASFFVRNSGNEERQMYDGENVQQCISAQSDQQEVGDSAGDGRLSNRRPRGRMAWEWGKPVFKFCQLKLCILVYFSYCLINFIHTTSGSTEKET